MKHLFFTLTFASLVFSQFTYADEPINTSENPVISSTEEPAFSTENAENAMLEIEKELLSLEDDLLNGETALLSQEESIPALSLEQESPDILGLLTVSLENALSEEQKAEAPFKEEEESSLHNSAVDILAEAEAPPVILAPVTTKVIAEPAIAQTANNAIEINLKQVLDGSPLIYFTLFSMSFCAVAICLYSIIRIKQQSTSISRIATEVRGRLLVNDFSSATQLCQTKPTLFSKMIQSGLSCRKHGLQAMMETMRSEGKRGSISFWQQLGLLQDIAIIAPMLGLLGTVIGLFYAFYDLNRSFESINNLLDGLGVSVGTTVAGIGVAILSMILYSTTKFKLVRVLSRVETEATSLAHLMDEKN